MVVCTTTTTSTKPQFKEREKNIFVPLLRRERDKKKKVEKSKLSIAITRVAGSEGTQVFDFANYVSSPPPIEPEFDFRNFACTAISETVSSGKPFSFEDYLRQRGN